MSRRDENTTKVFVGSLPDGVTTEDLKELFAPYGKIVECDIANKCGFLHLEDKELALKSIQDLNNSTFKGGRISVEKGRVKPPRRRDGQGRGGNRDRGGPYSRDNGYPRGPPRADPYGSYGGDRFVDYERGLPPPPPPPRGYGSSYDHFAERRLYEDRRGYLPLNSYDRRHDDHPPYDDRRQPSSNAYDDRRSIRPLLEQGSGSNEIFSRRSDHGPKLGGGYGERDAYGSGYGGKGYDNVRDTRYGGSFSVAAGYNSTSGGGYGSSAYSASELNPGSGYGSGGYNVAEGGYGDSYSNSRIGGSYDTSYSLPPQRSFASSVGGGSGPRRDNQSGPGRRY